MQRLLAAAERNIADSRVTAVSDENRFTMNASSLVQKLWNYCNTLRNGGLSYGEVIAAKSIEGLHAALDPLKELEADLQPGSDA
ncbi:MAG: hypothetical protein KF891_22745 [Rhizobacter sp.]|nr:hypothetical protein [Rhizobacter sp.]